jgi:maltooligosyltrehalose trehalohydrolase
VDPELGRSVTEGRRREFAAFGWNPEEIPDPQSITTFERSKLNWSESDKEPHAGLLAWHRRLIELRRQIPALKDGCLEKVRASFDETARWFVIKRGPIVVTCNLNQTTQRVPASIQPASRVLLASEDKVRLFQDAIELPPDSVAILSARC